jgi:hypothetical protein
MNASAAKAQWSRESNLKFSWVDRHDRWRGPSKWISWRGRFAFYCRFSLHEILGNNHDFVESIICHQDHKLTNDALAEFYEHVSEHDLVPGVVFHRMFAESWFMDLPKVHPSNTTMDRRSYLFLTKPVLVNATTCFWIKFSWQRL